MVVLYMDWFLWYECLWNSLGIIVLNPFFKYIFDVTHMILVLYWSKSAQIIQIIGILCQIFSPNICDECDLLLLFFFYIVWLVNILPHYSEWKKKQIQRRISSATWFSGVTIVSHSSNSTDTQFNRHLCSSSADSMGHQIVSGCRMPLEPTDTFVVVAHRPWI